MALTHTGLRTRGAIDRLTIGWLLFHHFFPSFYKSLLFFFLFFFFFFTEGFFFLFFSELKGGAFESICRRRRCFMKKNVSERLERAADQFDCQSARQNSWVTFFFSLSLSLYCCYYVVFVRFFEKSPKNGDCFFRLWWNGSINNCRCLSGFPIHCFFFVGLVFCWSL